MTIEEQRARIAQAERDVERLHAIEQQAADVRGDIERLVRRRDQLAALGDERLEVANPYRDERVGRDIELEAFRSRLTGRELAAQVDERIAHLRAALAALDQERGPIEQHR